MNLVISIEHRPYEQENRKTRESFEAALKEVAEVIRNELRDLIRAEAAAHIEGVSQPADWIKFSNTLKTRRLEEEVLRALMQKNSLNPQDLAASLMTKTEEETFLSLEEIKVALNEALEALEKETDDNLKALSELKSEKSHLTWLPDLRPPEEIERESDVIKSLNKLQKEKDILNTWLESPASVHEEIVKLIQANSWTADQRVRMLKLVLERLKEDTEDLDELAHIKRKH